ncbi:MAG: hypothetical protein ACE5F9_15535 [Phycisphaerae bacterium]
MIDDTFRRKLAELKTRIETLPPEQRERLSGMVEETRRRHADIQENFARARTALNDWRLQMKYAAFSIEAAQREQAEGRQQPLDDRE